MSRYAARRAGQYLLVIAVTVLLNFALPRLAPGSAIDYLLPPELAGALTPQQRLRVLAEHHLDGSTWMQLRYYLTALAHGDLGISFRYGRPVSELVAFRFGRSLLLVGGAVAISTALGVWLGFRAAWNRGTGSDAGLLAGVLLLDSMPAFFLGTLLLLVFAVNLHLFPVLGTPTGSHAAGLTYLGDEARRLVLPLVTLTAAHLGPVFLAARSALVLELREDYLLLAQASGLPRRAVRRHAQRNALLPVTTVSLLGFGAVVGGATVVETVFSYPGLGRLIYESVISRDYAVLQGAFLLLTVTVVAANLLGDLVYPLLDPRVRRSQAVVSS